MQIGNPLKRQTEEPRALTRADFPARPVNIHEWVPGNQYCAKWDLANRGFGHVVEVDLQTEEFLVQVPDGTLFLCHRRGLQKKCVWRECAPTLDAPPERQTTLSV